MVNGFFYPLGRFLYKTRWLIVLLWLIILLSCIPFASKLTEPFKTIGFRDHTSESSKANVLLNNTVGYSYNRFVVLYTSKNSFSSHPKYLTEIKNSLKNLKDFPIENKIIYPTADNHQISDDKHAAYAVVLVNSNQQISTDLLNNFKSLIKKPTDLELQLGGQPIFIQDTQVQTQRDLYKTEYFATPVAIITMLVVFGSVVAGILPIFLGGIAAFLTLAALYVLGHFFELSVFILNIALLLSGILSLDYALLIISRYRDELKRCENPIDAIANTQGTAGKSVFFSGLAVFISLSALLLFHVDVLFSVGIGGLTAVIIAMFVAITLLPAVLSILKRNIDFLPISFFKRDDAIRSYWHWLITYVVARPWFFFITLLMVLLALGYPFLYAKIGTSDYRILPKGVGSRDVFDTFSEKYGENKLDPILLVVQTKNNSSILEKNNIRALYDFVKELKKDKEIDEINSIVSVGEDTTKKQYEMMYTKGKSRLPKELKEYLKITTKGNLTVLSITAKSNSHSENTKELMERLQQIKSNKTFNFKLTGETVNTLDVKHSIMKTFPYAFLWILCFTYIILLYFLRSVILPLKAIFTTTLSLCASYGVLVLVFQEGYLHKLLHFEKQGIVDVTLLIIIFCALFGVSMDYEVFLLTRIKEYYEKTNNTIESIIAGIERSSKIITSAAIIVILLCFSFMTADIIMVKAFGLGIAVAVFVDAFIIRTLFVPAIMTLLGKWNWYAPGWLTRYLPKITFDPNKMD